jgi:hypothetical protein
MGDTSTVNAAVSNQAQALWSTFIADPSLIETMTKVPETMGWTHSGHIGEKWLGLNFCTYVA